MADEKRYAAKCPHCSTRLRVRTQDLGSDRTCPRCQQVFAVPNPEADAAATGSSPKRTDATPDDDWQPPVEVPIVCRVCQTRYYAREDQIGHDLPCPDCNVNNRVFPPPKPKKPEPSDVVDVRLTGLGGHRSLPTRAADQFRVVCRVCETVHYCLPKQVGENVRCSDCGSIFTVPKAPPKKVKAKVRVADPGIKVRPAAETAVVKTNADQLLEKAAVKYREKERLKPIPPKRPFRDKVWTLPFQFEVLPIFLVVSLLGCFIPFLASLALQMEGLASIAGMAIMAMAGVLAMLTYVVITNTALAITVSSSMGITKVDFPKFELFACFMTSVLLFTSLSVSFGPGVSLGLLTGIPWVSAVALPFAFVVFPFVFLSMLDASSAAVPYTPYMASTLKTDRPAWIKFYLASLPAFLLATLPHGVALWVQLAAGPTQGESPARIAVFIATTSLSTYGVLVYFCFVGRLAWVIDQANRDDDENTAGAGKQTDSVATAS